VLAAVVVSTQAARLSRRPAAPATPSAWLRLQQRRQVAVRRRSIALSTKWCVVDESCVAIVSDGALQITTSNGRALVRHVVLSSKAGVERLPGALPTLQLMRRELSVVHLIDFPTAWSDVAHLDLSENRLELFPLRQVRLRVNADDAAE
jgi:hypothetical protein